MSATASTLELVELLTGHTLGEDEHLLYLGERRMTVGDARKTAMSVAVQLREVGVKEGDLVVLDPSDEVDLVSGLFGVWAARAAVLVIDQDWIDADRDDVNRILSPVAWWGPDALEVAPEEERGQGPGRGAAYVEWRGTAADFLVHTAEDLAQAISSRPLVPRFNDGGVHPASVGASDTDESVAMPLSPPLVAQEIPRMPRKEDPADPLGEGPFAVSYRLTCHTGILTLLRAFLAGRAVQLTGEQADDSSTGSAAATDSNAPE